MNVANIDPNVARQQAAATELQNKGQQVANLSKSNDPNKEKKIKEACQGFESVFIQKMWEQMRASVSKSGLLESREEHYWQSMYDQELAKSMSEAGGIGLADMMYEQLTKDLKNASQNSSKIGAPIAISPAPLFDSVAQQDKAQDKAMTDAIKSKGQAEASAVNIVNNMYEEIDEPTVEDIELMELNFTAELLENELKGLDDEAKKNPWDNSPENTLENQLMAKAKLNTNSLMQANPALVGENMNKEIIKNEQMVNS